MYQKEITKPIHLLIDFSYSGTMYRLLFCCAILSGIPSGKIVSDYLNLSNRGEITTVLMFLFMLFYLFLLYLILRHDFNNYKNEMEK